MSQQQSLSSRREHVRADVCVIGAGIAGLIAATRIAAAIEGKVVVIESGGEASDPRVAELDTVDDPSGSYRGAFRRRGMGGTSGQWAGKLLPLSPHDMAARPHVGLEGWPVDVAVLARYTAELEAMMGVASGAYDAMDAAGLDPRHHLPVAPENITWRWPKHPARKNYRIDRVLRKKMAGLHNLCTWTDATVTDLLVVDERLTRIIATNHHEGQLTVEADQFVLAAGTLETTRLLLMADMQNEGAISHTTDALGRFFNDHFGINVATVRSEDKRLANKALSDRRIENTKRHLHGELSATVQAGESVASAYFDVDPHLGSGSATIAARALADSVRSRSIRDAARQTRLVLTHMPQLARAMFWKDVRGQQYWPDDTVVSIKLWIEQLPRYTNQLFLGTRRDSLGQPVLAVDMSLSDEDERTARTAVNVLSRFWERDMSHLGTLQWNLPACGRLIDQATEQAHPAGSTRMGLNPAHSVVNAELQVHAVPNIHVASASVFPGSGSANPTLTIMQLSMLAADTVIRAQRSLPA